MFNPDRIFDQFTGNRGGGLAGSLDALGGGSSGGGGIFGSSDGGGRMGGGMSGGLGDLMRGGGAAPGGGLGDLLGGMLGSGAPSGGLGGAGGGLLGSILGGRSSRPGGGGSGLMRMGGAAVLAALAARAFKAWQAQQAEAGVSGRGAATPASLPAPQPTRGTVAADDHPFGLAVVRAMIAAAKADGTLDGAERERIFAEVEKLELDSEEKGFVFQALQEQSDPSAIARLATNDSQKAELYLASRLVATPDTAAERAWLDALAHALNMPAGLRQSLDTQAKEAEAIVAAATGAQA